MLLPSNNIHLDVAVHDEHDDVDVDGNADDASAKDILWLSL